MNSKNKIVKLYLIMGICLAFIILCWLVFTSSLSSTRFLGHYSAFRFVAILAVGICLIVFSLGLLFIKKDLIILIFSKLLISKWIYFATLYFLILSLILLINNSINLFAIPSFYFERILPIIIFVFLLTLLTVICHSIYSGNGDCFSSSIPMISPEKKINLIVLMILVGFSIAVIYHYFQGVYLLKPYPQNTFLFQPDDRFNDFLNPVKGSSDLNPFRPDKITYKGGYLPFGYLVAFLFSLIKPWTISLIVFVLTFFFSFLHIMRLFLFGDKRRIDLRDYLSLFVLTFLSYPIIFAIDRANFDLIICIMLFLFVLFYQKRKIVFSTVFLGIAIAIKPFAGLLILLYVIDKEYKAAAILLFNVLLLTILSLSLFKDGLIIEIQKFITDFTSAGKMIMSGSIAHFSSDLYNFLNILVAGFSQLFNIEKSAFSNSIFKLSYTIFSIIIIIGFSIYLLKNRQPLWKKLLILTCLMILLPFASGDYRLIYFFPPLLLFLSSKDKNIHDYHLTILFGLLLIPKNYFTLNIDQNIGMLINPIIIILILITAISNRPFVGKKTFDCMEQNT